LNFKNPDFAKIQFVSCLNKTLYFHTPNKYIGLRNTKAV